jgi:hypothetical protein
VGRNGRHFGSVWVRGPCNPHIKIVSGGILPPGISNQMTNVVQSTIVASINSSASLIVGSTQPLSVASSSLPLVSNAFTFGMSSFGMQNMSAGSQPTPQVSSIWCREFFDSLPSYSMGWGAYLSIKPLTWECVFFHPQVLIPLWDGSLP